MWKKILILCLPPDAKISSRGVQIVKAFRRKEDSPHDLGIGEKIFNSAQNNKRKY